MLGREIGATFYGWQVDQTLLAPGVTPGIPRVIDFDSTYLDFPVLEYRPYRAFDTNQSSELLLQLYVGVDMPHSAKVIYPPDTPGLEMDRVYSIGVRLIFDWRRYF